MHAGKSSFSKGFTLIELLVTIAVLIVMATIAVPNFQELVKSNRLSASHNQILAGLSLAREEAVKRREEVTAVLSLDGGGDGKGWLLEIKRDDGSGLASIDCSNPADNKCVKSIDELDSPVTVGSPLTVTFNALGRPSSSVDLTISHLGSDKCLSINLAGVASKGACGG